jgi:sialic acid synthase SpsE
MSASRSVIVIAEIGENHLGEVARAREMIVAAARAGADVVKFQSYRGEDVASDDPERDWFSQVELSDAEHHELAEVARQNGVAFLSAPFSLERARFLVEDLGCEMVKVASSELTNTALLEYLAQRVRSVFLSTGMSYLDEVAEAVERLAGVDDLYVMHCTTAYPCPVDDANLACITTLRRAFPDHHVGYSDHTIGPLAAVAAAALGAEVVEKHFTLDKSLPGTDHVLSATPEELEQLVREVREVERLLGSPVKAPTESELLIRDLVRQRFPK